MNSYNSIDFVLLLKYKLLEDFNLAKMLLLQEISP